MEHLGDDIIPVHAGCNQNRSKDLKMLTLVVLGVVDLHDLLRDVGLQSLEGDENKQD